MVDTDRRSEALKIRIAHIGAAGAIIAALTAAIIEVLGHVILPLYIEPSEPSNIDTQAYIQEIEKLQQQYGLLSDENERINQEFQDLQEQNKRLNELNNQLQAQIDEYENIISSQPHVDMNSEHNNQDENPTHSSQDSSVLPIAVAWKDKATYESYSGNGNNGFIMFGTTYTNGFTISMGASYNMWGNGEQYVTYNISSISEKYSTLMLTVGHVDDYESSNIIVRFYLDKTIDDSADYEYTISPNIAPQQLSIDISGKKSMTIYVSNQGGSTNKIGFADFTFE